MSDLLSTLQRARRKAVMMMHAMSVMDQHSEEAGYGKAGVAVNDLRKQ